MSILDVVNAPWAIVPEKLNELVEIYCTHLRGDKIDLKGLEQKLGRPLDNKPKGYQVTEDGVALISVEGVLTKKMNLFSDISGGTSTQLLARDLQQALADASVSSVVMLIDSPGGSVDGTQEAARQVLAHRGGDKPVVAWVDGIMASGAYWIGSAADAVLIGADTDLVGSIGVAMRHVDKSVQQAQAGLRVTDIYAGKYKRIASENAPLTDEGRATLQAMVDTYYSIMVDSIAAHRGVSAEQVLSDMADGRTFVGQQAIDAGLVDGAATLDVLVADLAAGRYTRKRMVAAGGATAAGNLVDAGAASTLHPDIQEDSMNRELLEKQHPQLLAALIAEGHASGLVAGAIAERERIQSVEANAMPGHDALIERLKFDGKTTGPEAAVQVLQAEKAKKAGVLANLRADAPQPATATASATGDVDAGLAAAEAALPVEERARAQFDRDPKLQAEFQTVERYTGWLKHEERRAA